ncbi:hypothetical protein CEXT_52451 [Caerostris extrusa]|uniref:Uncharacterized protein n=1 Tax=Caerostris extrusa TaxID=172846 RepID=A0AAV4RTC5_CAEEX|nr:hypothetical protein CEXT_52451 [Caerostris extrusa]
MLKLVTLDLFPGKKAERKKLFAKVSPKFFDPKTEKVFPLILTDEVHSFPFRSRERKGRRWLLFFPRSAGLQTLCSRRSFSYLIYIFISASMSSFFFSPFTGSSYPTTEIIAAIMYAN